MLPILEDVTMEIVSFLPWPLLEVPLAFEWLGLCGAQAVAGINNISVAAENTALSLLPKMIDNLLGRIVGPGALGIKEFKADDFSKCFSW